MVMSLYVLCISSVESAVLTLIATLFRNQTLLSEILFGGVGEHIEIISPSPTFRNEGNLRHFDSAVNPTAHIAAIGLIENGAKESQGS